ncbi:MAG: ankyrin repeat-containing protein, partial [bacterium]
MTKTKLTLLIALKSMLISTIAMVISLYVSLLYLPRPSLFHPERNPNPPILWGQLFLYWIISLAIIGLAILLKNKFMAKVPANKDSNTPTVQPLITAWVMFSMISIPSGLVTMRIVNYISPSLRSHVSYHLSEAIRFNDQITLVWLLAVADSKQTLPLVDQAIQANSDTCLNLLSLIGVKPRKEALPFLMIQGAATGNNDMIKLMMAYGISIDIQTSYGQTPLIAAAEQNKLETIEFLIKSGANVNLTPKNSYPALIIALLNDNNAVVKSLIKAGIDVKRCKLQKEFSLAGKAPN